MSPFAVNCSRSLYTDLESAEKVFDLPVVRIICTDLPQYLAVVSRVRVESQTMGPTGGILSSTVSPQAQVVFPQHAIVKPIRVGLQVQRLHLLITLLRCFLIEIEVDINVFDDLRHIKSVFLYKTKGVYRLLSRKLFEKQSLMFSCITPEKINLSG